MVKLALEGDEELNDLMKSISDLDDNWAKMVGARYGSSEEGEGEGGGGGGGGGGGRVGRVSIKVQVLELLTGPEVEEAVECFDLTCCCVHAKVSGRSDEGGPVLSIGGSGVLDCFAKKANWTETAIAELKSLPDFQGGEDFKRTLLRGVKYSSRGVNVDFTGWLTAWVAWLAEVSTSYSSDGAEVNTNYSYSITRYPALHFLADLVESTIAAHESEKGDSANIGRSVAIVLACKGFSELPRANKFARVLLEKYGEQLPSEVRRIACSVANEEALALLVG
jgi:hypothetical protein